MRYLLVAAAVIALVVIAFVWLWEWPSQQTSSTGFSDPVYAELKKSGKIKRAKQMPNEWFLMQRAYPYQTVPEGKYLEALEEARSVSKSAPQHRLSDIVWTQAGPSNIPGRITDLAVPPDDYQTVYAASAAGGVFKSIDAGATWTSIFDEVGPQSIGALALRPDNSNIVFVGTGEANGSGDSYEGTGLYVSTDAGTNWASAGLTESYHIGRILIDPLRPDTMYVAVLGKLFGTNPERGVYRSIDGGGSWEQMLYIDDTTGCTDVAFDTATGLLYAAMWYRWRSPTDRWVGGTQSGIYRSDDFGDSWSILSNGLPAPADTVGRIGISVAPGFNTIYAIYANHPGRFMGVYKSIDNGDNWTRTNDGALENIFSSFGWYFGNIRVDADNPDIVFALGVVMYKTENGGDSWLPASVGIHVDHHALCTSQGWLYDGSDGGVSVSSNGGDSWTQLYDMPNTQFYAITIDYSNPQRLYGGTQDNGTMRTMAGGTDDWERILGGDGFYTLVDYTDPDIVYAEYQWGYLYKSTNGGYNFSWALSNIDYEADRHNWCTPFVMDPNDHNTLYYCTDKLYKTTNACASWSTISNDLTNGPGPGNRTFGTITTIDVAVTDANVIYVGTDDANVWVTQDGGGYWQNISAALPERWITRVAVDPHNAAVAYVTLSGYEVSDHLPRIYRTDNYGADWTDIHGDLPDVPLNDVIIDPDEDATLYVATDIGVYYTSDLGATWQPLGSGMPLVPVDDLAFHPPTRMLVAGTHGRSMFKASLAEPVPCCTGIRGNANNDPEDKINISDVTFLLDFLFGIPPGAAPVCWTEANANGDIDEKVNVSDVSYLLAYMFGTPQGPAPPACP